MSAEQPSVSIVVMADRHRDHLQACLSHLRSLRRAPAEIYVVDPSESRQSGVEATAGEIIAFLDAASRVEPDWLDELLVPYRDSTVVGVGGRVLFGDDDGEHARIGEIGCLLPNGTITANFAADPGRPVEADHLPSANVSFRRTALQSLGAVEPRYNGRSDREATEIALRLRSAGGRLMFQPAALVRIPNLGSMIGRDRFRFRDGFFYHRDQVVVLVQTLGWRSSLIPRSAWTVLRNQHVHVRRFIGTVRGQGSDSSLRTRLAAPAKLAWIAAELSGVAVGFAAAGTHRRRRPTLSNSARGAVRSAHHSSPPAAKG